MRSQLTRLIRLEKLARRTGPTRRVFYKLYDDDAPCPVTGVFATCGASLTRRSNETLPELLARASVELSSRTLYASYAAIQTLGAPQSTSGTMPRLEALSALGDAFSEAQA